MPIFNSKSTMAKSLKGLHLFHYTFSNCSQRVRLALAEKGLSWASHHLDLSKNEHITTEYQAINPKGVVPTLVYDGEVVVESNDILYYLEEKFPQPSLIPDDDAKRTAMEAIIHFSGTAQTSIKVITFDRFFRKIITSSEEDVRFFERYRNNQEVVQFMQDFHENSEAWSLRVSAAVTEVDAVLTRLDKVLTQNHWLSGDEYGLADISWVVNIYRMNSMAYAFDQCPNLASWFDRASTRKAFQEAVVLYQP